MASRLAVRAAGARDLPAIIGLWREMMAYHRALGGQDYRLSSKADPVWRAWARSHLRSRERFCFVAVIRGEIVGYAMGSIQRRPETFVERRYGHLSDAFVREDHRGKGVGRALTREALRWYRARRVRRVRLLVDTRNALGVAFWTGMGFSTNVLTMDRDI